MGERRLHVVRPGKLSTHVLAHLLIDLRLNTVIFVYLSLDINYQGGKKEEFWRHHQASGQDFPTKSLPTQFLLTRVKTAISLRSKQWWYTDV